MKIATFAFAASSSRRGKHPTIAPQPRGVEHACVLSIECLDDRGAARDHLGDLAGGEPPVRNQIPRKVGRDRIGDVDDDLPARSAWSRIKYIGRCPA